MEIDKDVALRMAGINGDSIDVSKLAHYIKGVIFDLECQLKAKQKSITYLQREIGVCLSVAKLIQERVLLFDVVLDLDAGRLTPSSEFYSRVGASILMYITILDLMKQNLVDLASSPSSTFDYQLDASKQVLYLQLESASTLALSL